MSVDGIRVSLDA